MAAPTSLLPLCATIFVLLLLLPSNSNAVPSSRSRNLVVEGSFGRYKDSTHMENAKENWEITESVTERVNLEVNDYPGSGANNRHTPRP